ncbi:antibiotic biosynthesis monooxygenase [Nocardia sp. NPDC051463]|uniref:antibiotic biosynthesis monooxygenase n=1 Tax=Nocardia sp. NPDC051463 TaxID=3154845 RepID=UPI003431B4D7
MSLRSAAEVVDLFNRAFVDRTPELLVDIIDEDCVMESTQLAPTGARIEGRAACLAWWQMLIADRTTQFTPQEVVVTGDQASILWRYRFGAEPGDWVEGVNLLRVHSGRIVEAYGYSKTTGEVPAATDSGTLTLIAGFTAKPGQEQRLRDELTAMIEPSLAEAGCLAYQPYSDPHRPDRMIIVEEWVDSAALDYHFTLAHFEHLAVVLDEILAEPFTLRRMTDLPV